MGIELLSNGATLMKTRYVLMRDDSGHWYVVPESRIQDFNKWTSQDEDWETPKYARAVGGAPNAVVFENPTIFGVPVSTEESGTIL